MNANDWGQIADALTGRWPTMSKRFQFQPVIEDWIVALRAFPLPVILEGIRVVALNQERDQAPTLLAVRRVCGALFLDPKWAAMEEPTDAGLLRLGADIRTGAVNAAALHRGGPQYRAVQVDGRERWDRQRREWDLCSVRCIWLTDATRRRAEVQEVLTMGGKAVLRAGKAVVLAETEFWYRPGFLSVDRYEWTDWDWFHFAWPPEPVNKRTVFEKRPSVLVAKPTGLTPVAAALPPAPRPERIADYLPPRKGESIPPAEPPKAPPSPPVDAEEFGDDTAF